MNIKYQYTGYSRKKIRSDILVNDKIYDYLKQKNLINKKRIIDLGCGNGKFSEVLAKFGGIVTGIDINENQIKEAKQFKNKLKIKYLVGDVTKLPKEIKKDYDLAISGMVIINLSRKEVMKHFSEANRVLKKQGIFIFGTAHPFRSLEKEDNKWLKTLFDPKKVNYFKEQKTPLEYYDCLGKGQKIIEYHHSFGFLINTLIENKFKIKKIIESRPSKEEIKKYKDYFTFESKRPSYLIILSEK